MNVPGMFIISGSLRGHPQSLLIVGMRRHSRRRMISHAEPVWWKDGPFFYGKDGKEKLSQFADSLARIILGGPLDRLSISQRIVDALALEACRPKVVKLVDQLFKIYPFLLPQPTLREVKSFLLLKRWTPAKILRGSGIKLAAARNLPESLLNPEAFVPVRRELLEWKLPAMKSSIQLAEFLGLTTQQLDWMSARAPFARCDQGDPRYEFHLERKSRKSRLLEIPYPKLMSVQRRLLPDLLDKIPLHHAAHGFRKGRSVKSYAEPHVGQRVVWRTDLANFFPSIQSNRIFGAFRTFGYPESVARSLTGLTTNRIPKSVFRTLFADSPRDAARELEFLYDSPHLPQGAPTSPAIANLISYRLDCRLQGLASKFEASYTRYADDLAFSGNDSFKKSLKEFQSFALAIILDEGFAIRRRKSVVMTASRQQQLAGIIVNEKLNTPRTEYKQLHAILHNCTQGNPESQNRDKHSDFQTHLQGRIAWMNSLNPTRGKKLQQIFESIEW